MVKYDEKRLERFEVAYKELFHQEPDMDDSVVASMRLMFDRRTDEMQGKLDYCDKLNRKQAKKISQLLGY